MRAASAIAAMELRRFLRDRSNIFFALILPLLLVLLIGLQFGENASASRALVVGPPSDLRTDLVTGLEGADVVVTVTDEDTALETLARGRADVGLLLDDEAVAAYGASDVRIRAVLGRQATSQLVQQRVAAVLEELRTEQARLSVLTSRGLEAEQARTALVQAGDRMTAPSLQVRNVDERMQRLEGLGQFDFGASGQLLLFTFLSTLAGAATLIQARRLGVLRRTLAAPVSALQLVSGEVLGRFAIAFFQGAYIMAASALLFDVSWGRLWLSLLVLLFFALVSAGAAMVLGALLDNEGAATGAGIGLGLVLAALGGSMSPLEFFPDTMRAVANLTPHAWAYEALADIQRRGAGLGEVLPELGVLAAMAALLVLLGSWLVRRSLARAM
jgi:ABC-2 type transport system permease protein